ncbi:hypothetical protein GALL_375630 [mine drainage metagenome]|uniref:Uncharacterized protein n=1 Tax=mine drainage metagenome TaxID=410659 RepID=A0A1J5QL43_9ZZZZ
MLNVSSAGIASGAGAPGLGGVMIDADLLQRLFSSTPIDYMNVAQVDFFRPYTEQDASLADAHHRWRAIDSCRRSPR